jgi:hypothetical protein
VLHVLGERTSLESRVFAARLQSIDLLKITQPAGFQRLQAVFP